MGSIKVDLNRSFLKEGALGVALVFVLGTRWLVCSKAIYPKRFLRKDVIEML